MAKKQYKRKILLTIFFLKNIKLRGVKSMWNKIFDIKNQLKQVKEDIKKSDHLLHAIEVNKQGLLYINSVMGVTKDVATGNYCLIGIVDNDLCQNEQRYDNYLKNIVSEYNELRGVEDGI